MYAVLSEDKIISLCDEPRYVKISESNGCYIQCNKDEAIALAVKGTLYNINGVENIKDAPHAIVSYVEAPDYIFDNKMKSDQNENSIVNIENAVCEFDATKDNRIANIENAICELDSAINGGVK